MVVYFKKMNNLFMLVGALVGAAAGLLLYRGRILEEGHRMRIFFFGMMILAGVVVGRAAAAFAANGKLRRLYAVLYAEADPKRFIESFTPLVDSVPKNLAEYADGCCRLSFAYEALGDFDQAMALLENLHPEKLTLHALPATSLVINQRCNLSVLKGEEDLAEALIRDLETLQAAAEKRASTLAQNLRQCVQLHRTRLSARRGDPDTDTGFLEEEIELSQNLIHRKEMQLELAEYDLRIGKLQEAENLLREVVSDRRGLYSESRAQELLELHAKDS